MHIVFLMLVAAAGTDTLATQPASAESTALTPTPLLAMPGWVLNPPGRFFTLRFVLEAGFTDIAHHVIQYGHDGSRFDYLNQGGEDLLFAFQRYSAELELFKHHNFIFLYQPLTIDTQATFRTAQRFNGLDFPAGTATNLRYGFDFYRVSYLYDFFADPDLEASIGASLQLRDASISFTSVDGSRRSVNQNIGFVPAIKARGRYTFKNGVFLAAEADFIWVSGKIIPTGANAADFEASLVDLALRAGVRVTPFADVFGSVRYLGGGARATEKQPKVGDGFTDDMLQTVIFSLGFALR